ncbi:YceD family protein [Heliophilum fasciatum]|uniref:DUF177 domain-containing protein n=1 Tax=Heliophilum fasciatum TaxID=35700 RepID=A0A4R2RIR3_9FIRM|nr:DUF177 domain-containing protein [Heliophilum fasciatum]MCW2278411.1 uncharacterized protein [Heliophilum fasciatum]TCP63690.1 uncharacterized protein EDD73_11634 [Heliophilum fasciatum]
MNVCESVLRKVREQWLPQPWSGEWQEAPDLEPDFRYRQPIAVTGQVLRQERGYRFQGEMTVSLEATCHRCLCPVESTLAVPVDATFLLSSEAPDEETEEDEDFLWYPLETERTLDLTPALRDALMLALPMKVLCRDDCPGLCPRCGTSLAHGSCDCAQDADDPRMAPLRALLMDKERSPI